jgi:hypothetical protein
VSGSVPLEFDEFDEDFLNYDSRLGVHGNDSVSRSTSGDEGDSGASVSTPSTSAIPLDSEADDVVGLLDEEQTPQIHAERIKRRCW